jgi:phytoene dehydrogenase-like protein
MECEVIVVGAGIGGLTTAALLAKRGMDVCLFERQSSVGGCVANFAHLGYTFEPTAGLYSGWEAGGIYKRLFGELGVQPPEVQRLLPAYLVRLPDHTDVPLSEDWEEFTATLRSAFPECADAAIRFYRRLPEVADNASSSITELLANTSERFRRFIDIQLQTLTQQPSETCPPRTAARALTLPQRGSFAIRGGAQALADVLAHSFKESGGKLRLNSPVLRLVCTRDSASGVDLLSGERVIATRAIISNLTIWDTYGKLIGPGRTPRSVTAQLKQMRAWGAYVLFASITEAAASQLNSGRYLLLTDDSRQGGPYLADQMQMVFSLAPSWDSRAPAGHRAVTIFSFTDVQDWFSFHKDETAHEEQDQQTLESVWTRLHGLMPELGDGIEVIETMTPRTFYENTRRRFGMIGSPTPQEFEGNTKTIFPNVFMIGDSVSEGVGIEGICATALQLADDISRQWADGRRQSEEAVSSKQ